MITHFTNSRKKRHVRIRAKISGTSKSPRVSIFRSNKYLYVQFIDDVVGKTLFGVNDKNTKLSAKNRLDRAKELGLICAKLAKEKKIDVVVFDRSGYSYHGRIKAIAEGLREGGIKV